MCLACGSFNLAMVKVENGATAVSPWRVRPTMDPNACHRVPTPMVTRVTQVPRNALARAPPHCGPHSTSPVVTPATNHYSSSPPVVLPAKNADSPRKTQHDQRTYRDRCHSKARATACQPAATPIFDAETGRSSHDRRRQRDAMTQPRTKSTTRKGRCTPPNRGRPPIARPERRAPDAVQELRHGLAAHFYLHRYCVICGNEVPADNTATRCGQCESVNRRAS